MELPNTKGVNCMYYFDVEKKKEEMKVILEIPEITIPGYKVEVDMSKKEVIETWGKISNMLEEMCLYIEEPEGEISCSAISDPINNIIECIYTQLIDAEEKYAKFFKKD